MPVAATETRTEHLRALPGDDVRQILWRFADRFDLQMLVRKNAPDNRIDISGDGSDQGLLSKKHDKKHDRNVGKGRSTISSIARCYQSARARAIIAAS